MYMRTQDRGESKIQANVRDGVFIKVRLCCHHASDNVCKGTPATHNIPNISYPLASVAPQ